MLRLLLSTKQRNYLFCPSKDRTSWNQNVNVIYIIQSPSFHIYYVGKTDRSIIIRLSEHQKKKYQSMFQHFRPSHGTCL